MRFDWGALITGGVFLVSISMFINQSETPTAGGGGVCSLSPYQCSSVSPKPPQLQGLDQGGSQGHFPPSSSPLASGLLPLTSSVLAPLLGGGARMSLPGHKLQEGALLVGGRC